MSSAPLALFHLLALRDIYVAVVGLLSRSGEISALLHRKGHTRRQQGIGSSIACYADFSKCALALRYVALFCFVRAIGGHARWYIPGYFLGAIGLWSAALCTRQSGPNIIGKTLLTSPAPGTRRVRSSVSVLRNNALMEQMDYENSDHTPHTAPKFNPKKAHGP